MDDTIDHPSQASAAFSTFPQPFENEGSSLAQCCCQHNRQLVHLVKAKIGTSFPVVSAYALQMMAVVWLQVATLIAFVKPLNHYTSTVTVSKINKINGQMLNKDLCC